MNFKKSKCIAKNFIYLSLMSICAVVVMSSVLLIIEYFMGELGMLIIAGILIIIIIISKAFDICR